MISSLYTLYEYAPKGLLKKEHIQKGFIKNIGSSSNLVVISFLFQLSSSFLILLKVVDMFAF